MPLFQIDTYDSRSIFAITEKGQAVQSNTNGAGATSYGKLMEFNGTNKSWVAVSAAEEHMIKNIVVSENEVFVLKNGNNAGVSVVNFTSNSIVKYGYGNLSILELGERMFSYR